MTRSHQINIVEVYGVCAHEPMSAKKGSLSWSKIELDIAGEPMRL